MSELSGVAILQNEIEKSRGRLKGFNENIKKLTGHENPGPRGRRVFGSERQEYDDNFSGRMGRGRGRLFGVAKRGLMEDSGPPVKRRLLGGAFSRLGPVPVQRRVREESPEEDEPPTKLSVHSSVVATSREAKNRQEIMQEQTKDKEGMQRNRRMFGLLLGTLNRFKTDSKTLESKAEQRKRIDQKLEENAEKEKKKFKQDTMELIEERHLEQSRISRLEQKMEVVQEHAQREKEIKKLKNFLCTKAKPRIFWMPRQMNTAAENKLKNSVKVVDEMLKEGQDRLEKEIKEVMERETKREERIKMRLREDGLFLDDTNNKEKENSEKEKEADNVGLREVVREDEPKADRLIEVSDDRGKKPKIKRRIVVEEHSDRDTDSEDDNDRKKEKEEKDKSVKKEISEDDGEEVEKEKVPRKKDSHRSDDDSESDLDKEPEHNKRSESLSPAKIQEISSSQIDADKDKGENDEESSRVVLYREDADVKGISKPEKGDKDRGSDDERRERRSHGDTHKHSHRRSKQSRKDSEKADKEDREGKKDKKRSRSSDDEDKESDRRDRNKKRNL